MYLLAFVVTVLSIKGEGSVLQSPVDILALAIARARRAHTYIHVVHGRVLTAIIFVAVIFHVLNFRVSGQPQILFNSENILGCKKSSKCSQR